MMNTSHRNYSEQAGDFNRLARFFFTAPRGHSTWCLGRITDWKYGLWESKRAYAAFCDENAHLWFDGFGELAGFIVSEDGDAGIHILTLPGYRFLYGEILAWALDAWKWRVPGKGAEVYTEITERQMLEAAALERAGFHCKSTFWTRRFDLTRELKPRVPLEPGFSIVDMQTHPDFRAQGRLRADAFQNKHTLTEAELDERVRLYNYSAAGPVYNAWTDLCVMAPDGQLVSGAEALINGHANNAEVERICTHSAFRRRGFARAVIQECLLRLQALGIREAYITGYSPAAIALYGSLGATDESRNYTYVLSP